MSEQKDVQHETTLISDTSGTEATTKSGAGGPTPDVSAIVEHYCVKVLATAAWQYMGLLPDPVSGSIRRDIEQAKVAVDCVSSLVQQIESRLTPERRRDLTNLVADLKVNYVRQLEKTKEGSAGH